MKIRRGAQKKMITPETIDQIVRIIVAQFNPRRIILFGSHGRGEASEQSDLDLFVEMETDLPKRERARRTPLAIADSRPCLGV